MGEKNITEEEVKHYIDLMGPQAYSLKNEEGIKKVASELVNQELMYAEALKNGLDRDPEYLEEVERIKEQSLKQLAIRRLIDQAQVSEEEARAYYEENKDKFRGKSRFKASHILVDSEEEANRIKVEIEGGKAFEEAAKAFSSCPSKESGGALGEFSEGQMVPEFEQALLTAQPGEVTEPVKTQFGYHLIRLDERKEAENKSYDEVKTDILRLLLAKKQQEIYTAHTNKLRQENEVSLFF